ncbi:NERD domain-containing protein [Salibacterium salarium]|uniref:NERD domain-containing protein n=1 Tax=Salibacterium salarium TaxID=284579 RepID=A0A3R9RCA5_9BACI|nr:nuclease-related domain-containing protein [Salibacterium salarium]RSL32173.1 NERD domain-containing protein [Salibacterium salarium]
MIIKSRYESDELRCLRSLNARMKLSRKEKQNFLYLEKGWEGEKKFDTWVQRHLSVESLILNDLLLDMNNTLFQIDSLILTPDKVYLFEVKNYEGDYYIDGEQWRTISGVEIKNPLLQLKRSESLLRQLFQNLPGNFPIEAYLLFVNQDFTLYHASPHLPIIFPSQLNRFMKKWNNTKPSALTQQHRNLADKLTSMHVTESPYTRLPSYDYHQLEKGILCPSCSAFLTFQGKKLICNECGGKTEDTETGILRNIEEFKLLFPHQKVTTSHIFEWCGKQGNSKRITRVLGKNFKMEGRGKASYYT